MARPMNTHQGYVSEDENPFRPPQSNDLEVPERLHKTKKIKYALLLFSLSILVGLVLSFFFIYSIMGSGVIISLGGIFLIVLGKRNSLLYVVLLGSSGIGISLFVFGLIVVNDWSPDDATGPVPMVALAYTLLTLPLAFVTYRQVLNMSQLEDNVHKEQLESSPF